MSKYIIIALLVAIVFLVCFNQCGRRGEKIVYKKGQKVVHTITVHDTTVKEKAVYIKKKAKIKLVRDTVHHYITSSYSKKINGYTLSISDTIKGDSLDRDVTFQGKDSIVHITKTDSIFITRTDTVKIKVRGEYWKGLKHGFAAGFAVGAGAAIAVAK